MSKKEIGSFYLETLGCAKNSVDSRSMAEMLAAAGYLECSKPGEADVIIVNTCGFIHPARQESLNVLRGFAREKQKGQQLVAAGCLSERDKDHLLKQVEGLDAVFGTRRWSDILKVMDRLAESPASPYLHFPSNREIQPPPDSLTQAAVQGASAYLKIADGCDRLCAFCAIPHIKGPMVSRPLEQIIRDARRLVSQEVKEIILIAQDTTAYGRDLGMRDGLTGLLQELVAAIPQVPWLRVMYAFPGSISDELIDMMAAHSQVLPYVDLPLQHAHPQVLQRMRRPHQMGQVRALIGQLRRKMPTLALRTTFIVGYPGETEEEFETLLEFLREIRFDHAGFFPYYHEPGTSAFSMADTVPDKLKDERLQRLAALQEDISLSINRSLVGKELDILVEGHGDGMSVGRSYRDAPEIDGLVLVNEILPAGELVRTRVTGALVHDLIAEKI
jgi:ribosomal protein S12 methylthiotransferase